MPRLAFRSLVLRVARRWCSHSLMRLSERQSGTGVRSSKYVPPNMALQRTRRPRFRSGRSLRSLGSPLNARTLGR
jgi:hypothetical protein